MPAIMLQATVRTLNNKVMPRPPARYLQLSVTGLKSKSISLSEANPLPSRRHAMHGGEIGSFRLCQSRLAVPPSPLAVTSVQGAMVPMTRSSSARSLSCISASTARSQSR